MILLRRESLSLSSSFQLSSYRLSRLLAMTGHFQVGAETQLSPSVRDSDISFLIGLHWLIVLSKVSCGVVPEV